MPVTHGVTGSSPVHTAEKKSYQSYASMTLFYVFTGEIICLMRLLFLQGSRSVLHRQFWQLLVHTRQLYG